MINKITLSLSLFFVLWMSPSNAQEQIEYISNHDQINEIYFEEDKIWVATDGGLLELDLSGTILKKHSVLDGIGAPDVEGFLKQKGDSLLIIRADNKLFERKETAWKLYGNRKKNQFQNV
jgi:hypothetical protein